MSDPADGRPAARGSEPRREHGERGNLARQRASPREAAATLSLACGRSSPGEKEGCLCLHQAGGSAESPNPLENSPCAGAAAGGGKGRLSRAHRACPQRSPAVTEDSLL